MTTKRIRALVMGSGLTLGFIGLMCAGGAVDGSGATGQVIALGVIGLIGFGVAAVAQRLGG